MAKKETTKPKKNSELDDSIPLRKINLISALP